MYIMRELDAQNIHISALFGFQTLKLTPRFIFFHFHEFFNDTPIRPDRLRLGWHAV